MVLSIDAVTALTLQVIRKRLADNVFLANPTAAYFLSQGRVELQDGGLQIQEPLMYTRNSTVMPYSGWDVINNTAQDEVTAAFFNWRQASVAISINGLEGEVQNSGGPAILSLLKAKVKVAEMSLTQFFDEKIHAPVGSKVAKDILGFDELIEDGGTFSTVGGIDSNVNLFWRNKRKLSGGLALLTQDMRNLYNTCSEGGTHPDWIVTTQQAYEEYENQNAGKQRISNQKLLDVGFENLMFKGATMVFNRNCIGPDTGAASSNLYMANSDFIRFVVASRRNFKMTQWKDPINQDGRVAQILVALNMTCNNRRFQGVLDGIA